MKKPLIRTFGIAAAFAWVTAGCQSSGPSCPADLGLGDRPDPGIADRPAVEDVQNPQDTLPDPIEDLDGSIPSDGTDILDSSSPTDGDPGITDTGNDVGSDAGPPPTPIPPITEPVPLRVGVAVVTMPVPVGINTAGFGGQSGSKTPFTVDFPGTNSVYMHPNIKAVFVEGGMGRLVFVRLDTVGVTSAVRESVLKRLAIRTGHDFSHELILGGTHTHSGPGRLIAGAFEVLADKFFPEFFDRTVGAIADAVVLAYQDLEPARFGHAIAYDHDLHSDRRCENPDFEAADMPLLRFDDASGHTKAVILTYAIHGTVLGAEMQHLSEDVAGAIERKIEEGFSEPVPVLFFNSWAADMAPGTPLPPSDPGPYSDIPGAYTRCEGLGNRAARTAFEVLPTIEMHDTAEAASLTVWVPLNREAIGYQDDEFPYPWGAVYCGGGGEGHCWSGTADPIPGLDHACLFFPEEMPAPDRTVLTVGRLGDLAFVTFPGEAVTQIGVDLRNEAAKWSGGLDVAFFGYTQDYTGYSTPEWDWWQGGYEASGAIWGPKQGFYLQLRLADLIHYFFDPDEPLPFTPSDPLPPLDQPFTPRGATGSLDPGQVVQDVQNQYAITDTVVFTFSGGDPWLGTPRVTLERKDGADFVPFRRANGTVVDSHGYEFSMHLAPDPTYFEAPNAEARRFLWTVRLPLKRVADQKTPIAAGTYRLRVAEAVYALSGECSSDSCTTHPLSNVTSAPFQVISP